mgnify:CR=1 FL=1
METLYDYKRFSILYVDDEEKSLKYFLRAFGDQFRILTATNAADGFAILQQHRDDIGLLITDQRMPGEKGVQLLERARQLNPRIIRVLATAYSDLDAAIQAVNTGAIYKYVTKPWEIPQLEVTLRRGLEFFMVQRERDTLLREKLSVLHKLVITDRLLGLGIVASGLGHQLQNALTAVQDFVQLAQLPVKETGPTLDEFRNPTYWKGLYDHVQNQVRRIGDVLQLLGMTQRRREPAFDHELNVRSLIAATVDRFAPRFQAQGITIESQLADDLPALKVDLPTFERLFELLFEDELGHLSKGGRLWLKVDKAPPEHPAASGVAIEIADDGPALSEANLRSVFDPLVARQTGNFDYGVNLMAAYLVVYHHNGHIEVQAKEGGGTVFKILLPSQPALKSRPAQEKEFLDRVLLNDALWEQLLITG